MEDKGLADVAPVVGGTEVVYEQDEQQHECYADRGIECTDQEHHQHAAQDAEDTCMPSEETECRSKHQRERTGG